MQGILDNMVEGVLVCDNAQQFTMVNRSAARLLGIADPSAPNLPLKELLELARIRFPDEQDMSISDSPWTTALKGTAVVNEDQIMYSPQEQRNLFVRTCVAPLRDARGVILGAVAVVHDVTVLTELDRLKDQFISVAAHELKTPIALMRGYAQMLLQKPDNLRPAQHRMLDTINRSTQRMARIVEDLLDIEQLQAGHLALSLGPIDLLSLVEQTADEAAPLATKHRIHVTSAQPVTIQGDQDRLRQVLHNLINNAIKFSPNEGDIEIAVEVHGAEAVVSVADHGIGIPRDKQTHIFQRFYRAHADTPSDYGGIGVGLFISQEIIAQHAGRMWFESEEGEGSTFYFSLPLAGTKPEACEASPGDSGN